MRLTLVEHDKYYFDEAAAQRPVNFIERYLFHWEGEYEGKPFTLMPWQREDTRNLFGWKRRSDGRRRFREMYMEIAKGNGKSPWLSAIGLYMLLADNEPGALVVSAATDFQQANVTFDFARKMVPASPRLDTLCELKQFTIEGPRNGLWRIVSGEADGKHGIRPTCLLMDEAHEWPNRKLYDNLTSNAGKRHNSLILVATNAGASKESICWELRERARKVLEGESREESLYPVLYCADKGDDPGSVKTWRKANPAYDSISTLPVMLENEWSKAQQNPALEARFRRLHLSQWVQGSDKWLDMNSWDACAVGFKSADVVGLPCYLGLDLSQNDDLSALTMVWTGPKKWFTHKICWIPKATARKYEDRDSTPYAAWARAGHIELLPETTVSPRVKRRIARRILALTRKYDVRAVLYDRYKASDVIAWLEKKGVTCIPVKQGFDLSPACQEIERRLKDRTMVLRKKDPCFRWQASNVEVEADKNGNIRIVKQAAKGKYQGLRSSKIDAVASLVNAVSQILRAMMGEEEEPKEWNGVFEFI
jgi:phage terminase large subunit-like protein